MVESAAVYCCPQCGSDRTYKDGLRYAVEGSIQRYLCRSCFYRFSEAKVKLNIRSQITKRPGPKNDLSHNVLSRLDLSSEKPFDYLPFLFGEDVASHRRPSVEQKLNSLRDYNRTRQVCVSKGETKNLSATEQKETVAGEASIADQNVKGKIVEFAWQLQRDGLKEESIKTYVQWLNMLLRKGANLFAPETVKEVLARQKWGNATKSLVIAAYDKFASLYEIRWKPPKCENTRKLPFIPLEQEIDDLVASCGKKTSAILRLIKETGIRIGEALRIRWIHLDLERNILVLNDPEKHGQPRMFKISNQLVAMLNRLPKATDEIFGKTQVKSAESSLRLQRNRAATKLGNPRLRQIHFHTLRHWKATMEYQKTKSIIHVMQKLGHRNINSTMIYTHIIDIETKDEYHSAVAKNIEEAGKLVETGFDYVCSHEGLMLFRRRKQKNA